MKKEILEKLEKLAAESNQRVKNAALIEKDGEVIVALSNAKGVPDPTGHAEINVIREACKLLNTGNLKDCSLYTFYEPCDMCLHVIASAGIKKVFYVNSISEEEKNIINSRLKDIELINDKAN